MATKREELAISVSLERTVNLGNYESAKVWLSVAGVRPGTTEAEVEALLENEGRIVYSAIARRMREKVDAMRPARSA